eukprot:TRINITY_DN736_c0_g3_i1.p1 TRINITY_DN736_c0_g3~~TRINITY_DN736_c0_g3_i1.p1  ORF type:complete len:111 (+),score=24.91 TRINITY_DN736_c0_g3_i1:834-1166(+)
MAVQKWQLHPSDTASNAVQIDILTQRIRSLNSHLMANRKDTHNQVALQKLIKRRKGLMVHLKKTDVHLYYEVLREIKVGDLYELYGKFHTGGEATPKRKKIKALQQQVHK